MPIAKEQIRQIISENNINSVSDVYNLLRDSFREILSRAAYVVLGMTAEGDKEILSITVGANETSKFWLGMLNDLHNRGVKDVLFFCVDGLPDLMLSLPPRAVKLFPVHL